MSGRAFTSSIKNQFINSIGRPMFRFCVLVQPLINGYLMGMLYRNHSDGDFTLYALVGGGIMTFWGSMAFSSAADIQREKWYGTMENLFACPAGFRIAVLGKIVGNTIWGLFSFFLTALFAGLLFRRNPGVENPALFLTGFLLMIASFIAFAFLIAALFTISRKSRVFMNMLEHPVYILCGVVFPLNILPPLLRLPSWILSPRWASEVLRHAIGRQSWSGVEAPLAMLTLLTAIYWLAGWKAYVAIDRKARVDAVLGVY